LVDWFIFGGKVYPCQAKDEPVTELTYYGSGPKRVMVQEHPCLYRLGKCRHITCASKAHHNGYECPCPAGEVTYAPGTTFVRRSAMFHEHPCAFVSGKMCHHIPCAVEAHQNGYQCQLQCPSDDSPRLQQPMGQSLVSNVAGVEGGGCEHEFRDQHSDFDKD